MRFFIFGECVDIAAARGIINAAAGRGIEAENEQAQAGMDRLADALLGIRPDALGKIASFFGAAVGKTASARPGTAGLVSLLLGTGAGVLSTITQNLLEGEEQPLSFLQTLSGLFKLRGAAAGEKTDADGLVSKALAGAVAKSLSGAQVHTGNAAFDGMATMAAQSGGSAETAQKRWGDAGVNYFANLVSAGRGDVAAILQTLPSYAKSVIVAEQNMRTFTLSPEKLYSQLRALQQDLYSPEVMQNALQRARLQAENASIGQKIAGGALAGLSVFQKEVDDAKAGYDQKQAELDSAKKAGQAAVQSHAAAHALFMKNLTDSSAVDGLMAAINQWQASEEKYRNAEQGAADSQKTLDSAQRNLDAQSQKITGVVTAEIRKEIDQKVKGVVEQFIRTGKLPLNVSIFKDEERDKPITLAPKEENGIMEAESDQGAAGIMPGDMGSPDGIATGEGNNPYSHLGIEDADYQAYLERKLTEDDLLGIANAAALNYAASGSGNWAYMYQNEAHDRAANIRAKYDPDYIKNDTFDYTHGGRYDPSSIEPMPGPPKYEVLTSLPGDGNQDVQVSGESGSEEEKSATPGDLLAAVMAPEQLAILSPNNDTVYSMLSKEQKHRVDDGEDLFSIIEELESEKQHQIEQMSQDIYDSLSGRQKKDLLFLGSSYAFGGESLAARLAILQWLKENQREITYEDLVELGSYAPGELEDAGRDWASTINLEYDLVYNEDASIAMLDREQELQRGMEVTMLLAMTAAPLINTAIYGRTLSPKEMYNPNSRADNIERQGTTGDFKGSNFSWNPPGGIDQEHYAAKSSGWIKPDGSTWWPGNNGFDDIPEKMTLQRQTKIDRYGNERGVFASPEGVPFDQRSLASGSENSPYNTYEVIEPFDVYAGKATPWFDQPGGGTQYQLPMSIEELRRLGYIKIITK